MGYIYKYNQESVFESIVQYLSKLRTERDIRPLRLFVFPSGRCREKCSYCSLNNNKPGVVDLFSKKKFVEKLIVDIKESGFIDIHLFGGGEPFFYKENMMYFLESLQDTDGYLRIITNGMNLEEKDIKLIVKKGLVSQLNLTLNYASEELSLETYGNRERHRHTLYILQNIKKYKSIYRVKYPFVDIMFVLMNNNYRQLPQIIKLVSTLDINYFFLQPLRIDCEYHKTLALSEKDKEYFVSSISILRRLFSDNGIRSNIDDFVVDENFIDDSAYHRSVVSGTRINFSSVSLGCYFPLTTVAILNNGTIPKCFFLPYNYYQYNYLEESFRLSKFLSSSEFKSAMGNFIGPASIANCPRCTLCILYEFEEIKRRLYASASK